MSATLVSAQQRIAYWNTIYKNQGRRWSSLPSLCAHLALADIAAVRMKGPRILDVGCGYGRDLALFGHVFSDGVLTGLDASNEALRIARDLLPNNAFVNRDLFSTTNKRLGQRFDVVFSNYFLHLLFDDEIVEALRIMRTLATKQGLLVSSLVSTRDRHYGKGKRLGFRSYEVAAGLAWRFADEDDAARMWSAARLRVLAVRAYAEVELVGGRPDPVSSLYVIAVPE